LVHPKQHTPEEAKLLGELNNSCVKIPLLWAIKDVPFTISLSRKSISKGLGEEEEIPPLSMLLGSCLKMLRRVISLKCLDPSSPIVDVHIDSIMVPNTLIDLRATINVMTKETMFNMNLQWDLEEDHYITTACRQIHISS